jgi:hypothetical protein
VTTGVQSAAMTRMGRSGVLVARAWHESDVCGGVRVRVMWSAEAAPGVSSTASGEIVVQTGDDLLAIVTSWLARIMDAQQSPDVT